VIDDDDAFWILALWPFENPILAIPGIILVIVVAYVACQNEDDCSKRQCQRGTPSLIKGECLCTERAR